MYLPVWIEIRYFAPFIVFLLAGSLASLRLPNTQESKRLIVGMAIAVLVGANYSIGELMVDNIMSATLRPPIHTEWLVADQLNSLGIYSGDRVARIGGTFGPHWGGYWARLAKVKIIAEVDTSAKQQVNYWQADTLVQNRVLEAFKQAGAKAVVADKIAADSFIDGWQQITGTDYYVKILNK